MPSVAPTLLAVALVMIANPGCGRMHFDETTSDAGADGPAACIGDFVVDTDVDDPGQALACGGGGGCSLRAAIAQANARARSTICLGEGLSIAVATSLVVTRDITIAGPGTAICGTGADRVFEVATTGTLRLRDLTVCHGRLTDASGAAVRIEDGGTLDADGVVFDDHVALSDAVFVEGGAVRADGNAVVELRRSRFTNNRATQVTQATGYARGGALAIRATTAARLVIEDTAFEDNDATNVGGALFLAIDGADLTVRNTLFARNRSRSGAAIDVNCAATGTLEIGNSTFVDNTPDAGSVIYVCGTQTMRLSFCSFRGNAGDLLGLETATSRVEWRANAISATTFRPCGGMGTGLSLGANVADRDDAICALTNPTDVLQDPMFATLADHGGATPTIALLPGSPAIDAAGTTSCPPTDQRGMPRPIGAACDAGAFEAQ